MRAPAIPLITVDPYFSVWSRDEVLNFTETVHWTGAVNPIRGYVVVDNSRYLFLGYDRNAHKIKQISADIQALCTLVTYECDEIRFMARFMTPLLPDDFNVMSRPVSYLELSYESLDGREHNVSVEIRVREDICLDRAGQSKVIPEIVSIPGTSTVRMGNSVQSVLNRSGDDLRIDWGYFYLSVKGDASVTHSLEGSRCWVKAGFDIEAGSGRLVMFAYDDVRSISYFGRQLTSVWNRDGMTIDSAIAEAAEDYDSLVPRCQEFGTKLYESARQAGGEKYAELLTLSYRQVIAGHKIAVDEDGELLFISKECFSNGCAATVDVSYPSIPMFLLCAPELVKGMMRPIYKFASTKAWKYDFAPHDAGQYPLVEGQVYGLDRATGELLFEKQMPVEECGNMLIMEANVALAEGNADFAASHINTLETWCKYLIKFGDDPENQLCTDDFAGHLAHNCNLSLKAVMGIQGMSIIMNMLGDSRKANKYRRAAVRMAKSWCERAVNEDGSYRLAFDQPDTFSMKYNMVWDKIWGTRLFPQNVMRREIASNFTHFNSYGMPLDSRADYTKSDWLVWTATMAASRRDFERFVAPLWDEYNESDSRVPMTDWYDTISGYKVGFQHRTVQGGLFIKLLDASGKLKYSAK